MLRNGASKSWPKPPAMISAVASALHGLLGLLVGLDRWLIVCEPCAGIMGEKADSAQVCQGDMVLCPGESYYGFKSVEQILDYEIVDEVCMTYEPSPIAERFEDRRSPQQVMNILCDLPSGARDLEKATHINTLARVSEYQPDNEERLKCIKEGVMFAI